MMRLVATFAITTVIACGVACADPCTASLPKKGVTFSGEVRYIVDGDGLCVGNTTNPGEWIEVRLQDFYAPELREKGGQAAKLTLDKIAMGKQVTCVADHRSWDRIVAHCTVQGFSIGDVMRRAGVKEGGNR